jgi:chemotaxis protein methyltransferase CheR
VSTTVDESEVKILIEGLRIKYGYDFRDYAEASLWRRVESVMRHFQASDPIELLSRALKDRSFFMQLLGQLTVTTSEMFRDPEFYLALRKEVLPYLRTFPSINVWSAGCSTGEEVLSLAVMFKEENLLDRTTIYATDINPRALKKAKEGIFRADSMKLNTRNYIEAGGTEAFSRYYTADYGLAKMNSDLLENVAFSEHNLVTDQVFTECQLILCRNVMIYFNGELQDRVLELMRDSLRVGGVLAIGSKESLAFSSVSQDFEAIDEKWRVFRRRQRRSDA